MTKAIPHYLQIAYPALTIGWLGIGFVSVACWTFLYLNPVGLVLSILFVLVLFAGPTLLVRYCRPSFVLWRSIIRRTMIGILSFGLIVVCVLIFFGKQFTGETLDDRYLLASPSQVLTAGAIGGFIILAITIFLFNRISAWVGPRQNTGEPRTLPQHSNGISK